MRTFFPPVHSCSTLSHSSRSSPRFRGCGTQSLPLSPNLPSPARGSNKYRSRVLRESRASVRLFRLPFISRACECATFCFLDSHRRWRVTAIWLEPCRMLVTAAYSLMCFLSPPRNFPFALSACSLSGTRAGRILRLVRFIRLTRIAKLCEFWVRQSGTTSELLRFERVSRASVILASRIRASY